MIRIAVCDDEKECRDILIDYVNKYCSENAYTYMISEYTSGEELLDEEHVADIILLDVEMSGIDGVSVKNRLRHENKVRIIFVTGHSEVMAEAFGMNVVGFLAKPLEYRIFSEKMEEALYGIDRDSRYIEADVSKSAYKKEKILLIDIVYIRAEDRYTKIVLNTGEAVFSDRGIGSHEKELKEDFGLANRSCLINYRYIKNINKDVEMKNGECISLSRRRAKLFKEEYREYVKRQVFM